MHKTELTFLIIEDSTADYLLLTRHLAQNGLACRCHRVENADSLRGALHVGAWDMVLSDYNLPGMVFGASLSLIQSCRPDLPVILISGSIGEEQAVDLLKQGVADFVLKNSLHRLIPAIERSLRDVAERRARRAAEDALRERERHFRMLVETTFDWIWEMDAQGRYVYVSPRVTALLGYTPEQVIGRTPFDFMPADEAERLRPVFAGIFAGRQPFSMLENVNLDLHGRRVVLETSGMPVLAADGQFTGYQCAGRDISERKEAERAIRNTVDALTRSNDELERLTFAASHDLQEPVRGIVSFAQLIERRLGPALDSETRQDLGFMVQSAYRMRDIVTGLLAFSELTQDSGHWSSQDCTQMVEAVRQSLAGDILRAGATLAVGPLPVITGNGEQLHQLFHALISNALKFVRPAVPPCIEISAKAEGDHWRFSVADNGLGIEPQYFDQMFRPFKRLHTNVDYPGPGLGLAMARRVVERHGGRIWIESAPGNGTTMIFTLGAASP